MTQEPSLDMSAGHDKFCNQTTGRWDGGCQCDLIAQIRADEREKTITDCIEIVKGAGRRSADNGFSRVGPLEIIAAMRKLQRKS